MAEQLRGLSASDVSKIKRLMASHNNRPVNTTTLPIVPEGDWHENQQTEAYIVKTPEGGIPAMVDGGSGDYRPGSAVCPVYRIGYDLTNNIGEYVLYQSTATDRLVFNVSLTAIEENTFLLVDRDKHGNWVANAGGQRPEGVCELPATFRIQVGTTVTKATVSGVSVVTEVIQKFRDITFTEDGCMELSEPYCEPATTETCVEGEDPGPPASPSWYCVDGECWKFWDALVPGTYEAGPFASKELCVADCPYVPPPGTIETTCCEDDLLPATLNVTIPSGPNAGTWSVSHSVGEEWRREDAEPGPFLVVACISGLWYITVGPDNVIATETSCNPLSITFTAGGITCTVTE